MSLFDQPLESLAQGQELIETLEEELVYLVNDFLNFQDQLSPVGQASLRYTILMTEEAIQRLQLEIKMFEE